MQAGVIDQVLADRQVGIHRAALKDHAQTGQRLRRFAPQVVARHADHPRPVVVEPRHKREQRGLARAIHPQKGGESAARHRQRHVVQRLHGTEIVADMVDLQRGGQ